MTEDSDGVVDKGDDVWKAAVHHLHPEFGRAIPANQNYPSVCVEHKTRGRKTVVVDTNIPRWLLISVRTQDSLTTGQLAQNTFGMALPHKGSMEARYRQDATEKAG